MDTYIANVFIAKIKINFRSSRRFVVILARGFMENYKIWTKHGEDDENLPKEAS